MSSCHSREQMSDCSYPCLSGVCLAFGSAASWISVTIRQTGRRLCARTAGATLGSPSGPGPHSSTHTTPTTHLGPSWPLLSIRTPLSYLYFAPNPHVFSQNKLVRKVFGLSLLEVKALGTGPDCPSQAPLQPCLGISNSASDKAEGDLDALIW